MILIVDDVLEIVELLAEIVQETGYHVDHSMDGISALHKMKYIHYAMAIIDIRIPGIDGNTLASRVKSMPEPFCNVPLVGMTGSNRVSADENLFVEILQKPFLYQDVRKVIEKHARAPIRELHET